MPKTPLLVFDLDDTLYDEMTFVYGGFKAVAAYLKENFTLPERLIFSEMKDILEEEGRGAIFDRLLKKHSIYSKKLVDNCIQIYRHHPPKIKLYPDALRLLKKYKNQNMYIVTDGHKEVQNNKIKALGLASKMKHCYITHRHGKDKAKPSPYCFQKICQREKKEPCEVVYIADNPYKDFVGLKPLGFQTIRILRGHYKDVKLAKKFEADRTIITLDDL